MGGTTAKLTLLDDLEPAALAPVRSRARLPLRAGQRPAGAHPRDRAGRDRRRRRLDRPPRCAGPHRRSAPIRPAARPAPPATAAAAPSPPSPTPTPRSAASIPQRFAGGAIPLHRDKAEAALQSLAGPLKTDAAGRGGRRRRDRRRDHGECRPRARRGERQGHRRAHPDRLRRRRAAACRATGAQARHEAGRRAGRRRRRLGLRLPARADRLRGRAHAPCAARPVRRQDA